MAPSTLPASPSPETADPFALAALERFYRLHARIYDWTRPLLLYGRGRALSALALLPGERVLDVGCGTGWSLPRLHARGARVVGVESSAAMRERALARLERYGLVGTVDLDPRPYGSHAGYLGQPDAVLFSYSLSMIPPYAEVLARSLCDLRSGGRIAVVDFEGAWGPVAFGLRRSHVHLGRERLAELARLFPQHRLERRSVGLWSSFLFVGVRP